MLHPLYLKSLKTLEYDKVIDRLCEFAVCRDAAEMARNLLPASEFTVAQGMLSETVECEALYRRRGSPPLYSGRNITDSLNRAQIGSTLPPSELLEIAAVYKTARLLLIYKDEDSYETGIDYLFASLTANKTLENRIYDSIISEDEIADGASGELYNIRRKMRLASNKVRDVLNKIITSVSYQKYLQDNVISMRDGRYVIPVKQECRGEVPGIVHDTSSSGATVFVEPMAVVEANNELKTLMIQEKREIERILSELSAEAASFGQAISENYRAIVSLDFVFSKAKLARALNGIAPELNEDFIVDLKSCRHPLIDPEKVVPTDIRIGGEYDTLVITGPNTGGKTVVLKTTGLFCAMAASGLMIPAAIGSKVCIFSKIFADIGDEQSIEQSLSTFSSHMSNIIKILEGVDYKSLVLFDELGAGTDPVEGSALAIAILEEVRNKGAKCAATTHYSELKLYALSSKGVQNAACEFDVRSLKPTYKLLIGLPGKSNAFAISGRLGLPEDIIERARERISKDDIAFEDILNQLEGSRQKMEQDKAEAEAMRREIKQLRNETKQKKEHYEKTRDNAMNQARLNAQRIVEQAKYAAQMAIDELEAVKKQKDAADFAAKISKVKGVVGQILSKAEDNFEVANALKSTGKRIGKSDVKKGDEVLLLNINHPAIALTEPDNDGNFMVQAGIMKIKVNLSDVRLSRKPINKEDNVFVSLGVKKADRAAAIELDIRGLDVEQGIMDTEKFLDNAIMSGLNTVTIIHGKGTGALRAGIHNYLKTAPNVKSYRLGKYGEGEMGVTIVELK